jgi:putative transposase
MIVREQPDLSVRRQCELLRVSRSGLYYEPEPRSPEELALMRRLDELHLERPFYGSRKLSEVLRKEGREASRKRIQRLMRVMGLEAMAPQPQTSEPHPEHVKYPYLLRGLVISRVNHVWATDITYIPMKAGFVYLVAIMDWYSRRVLSWRDLLSHRGDGLTVFLAERMPNVCSNGVVLLCPRSGLHDVDLRSATGLSLR